MVNENASISENYNININKKFGDGLIETSTNGSVSESWNSSSAAFVGEYNGGHYPFFNRGGIHEYSNAGTFFFSIVSGASYKNSSFRLSLSVI